jgi:DNA replication and repair protein RecF
LEAWDEELVTAGAQVTHDRAEAIERLRGPAGEEFTALTTLELLIAYVPSVPLGVGGATSLGQISPPSVPSVDAIAGSFRERLGERRGDELMRRSTLVGPHRDDLDLKLRELVVRGFASHGESWAAALALRIGQARATAAEAGEPPITLLDDPFSGIDPVRAQRLSDRLAAGIPGLGQVLVSTADEREVPSGAIPWRVRAGAVEGATRAEVG